MEVRVDGIEEELPEGEGPGAEEADKLGARAVHVVVLQQEKCHRRKAVVVWVDERDPSIPGRGGCGLWAWTDREMSLEWTAKTLSKYV